MKEIEAGIIKELTKFIESLSSMITARIASELIKSTNHKKRNVTIYR